MNILGSYLKTFKQKFPFLLICLLMFFPVIKVETASKLVFLSLFFIFLFNFKKGFHVFFNSSPKYFIINTLFYLLLAVSLVYSVDKDEGLKIIVRQISFLLFPLSIFYFLRPTKKQLQLLAKLFVLANFISITYLLCFIYLNTSIFEVASNNFDFRSVVTSDSYRGWHPTYLGVFLLSSIILLIENCFSKKTDKKQIAFSALLIVLFSFAIFVINSRIIVYAYIIIVPLCFLIKTKTCKQRLIYFGLLLVFFSALYYLLSTNFSFNYRLVLQLKKIYAWVFDGNVSTIGIDVRYFINQCNTEIFLNNPLLGLGIGDVGYNLSNCYLDKEFLGLYNNNLNPHNNYFYILLSGGLVTLISFLILIIINLYLALTKRNFVYFFVQILMLLVFFTEAFFGRLSGILFFALANTLMFYYTKNYSGI